MPTLRRRNDGCYFIQHFFHQHSTWQVQGEGVRQLTNYGINEGQYFPTDVFMELWMQGLVYHGNIPPTHERLPVAEHTLDLRLRIQQFHQLLYRRDAEAAWGILWKNWSAPNLEEFRGEVNNLQLASWRIADPLLAYDIPLARQPEFDGAVRLGVVHMELGKSGSSPMELKQFWFESDGQWRMAWLGFRGEGLPTAEA